MTNLTELRSETISFLGDFQAFSEVDIISTFQDKLRAFPLKKPVITVECAGVEINPAGLGGYFGGDTPVYGRICDVEMRFCVYSPVADSCLSLFESLCNCLLSANFARFKSIRSGDISFDSASQSHTLPCTAKLQLSWVIDKETERLFNEFLLKEVTI